MRRSFISLALVFSLAASDCGAQRAFGAESWGSSVEGKLKGKTPNTPSLPELKVNTGSIAKRLPGDLARWPVISPADVPVFNMDLGRKFDPRVTMQQAVPGAEAGNYLQVSLSTGLPKAPNAEIDAALLRNPDPTNPRSRQQVTCDSLMDSARKTYADWRPNGPPAGHAPLELEEFPMWFRVVADDKERLRARPVAERLDRAMNECFSPSPPEGFGPALRSAIGALVPPDGVPICSVFRTGAHTVVTARHCVEPQKVRLLPSELARHKILIDGASVAVEDFEHVDGAIARELHNDWVVLRTAAIPGSSAGAPRAPHTGPVPVGTRLVIGGLLVGSAAPRPEDRLGYSATLGCMVTYATESCIAHTCNTFPGFSGAPIFIEGSDGWRWLAVHSRAMTASDREESCPPPKPLPSHARLNASLPAAILP